MANKCITPRDARRRILRLMDLASSAPVSEAPKILLGGFKQLADDADPGIYQEIIEMINKLANKAGMTPFIGDPSFVFSENVDINRAIAEAEERIRNLARYEETIVRRGQAKKLVLKGIFGDNTAAQEYYLRSTKNGFGQTYGANGTTPGIPGLIDIFFAARNKHTLVRSQDIAENVRDAKQELLDKVIEYLLSKELLNVDISDDKDLLFDDNGNYTGILDKGSELYEAILATFDAKRVAHSNHLDSLYTRYKRGEAKAREELEAYNAWQLLNNFDTTLVISLGDSVVLTEPGKFNTIGNTSYKTNIEKATNMWSFGFGDDVSDVGDLVSTVTLDLVESSRRYTWKGPAIDDAYISFKDFNYIIGKIKSLAITLPANDIVLNLEESEEDQNTSEEIFRLGKLSETTKDILRAIEQINKENGETDFGGKPTLGQLVAFMSENPMRHLHAIFDVLCNTDFIERKLPGLTFDDNEKNLIWSLHLELFGKCGPNSRSLFDLHHNTKGDTIFPIITQIADSMFAEDTILYYEDENGVLYAQLLRDYAINQLRNELSLQIQQLNGYFTTVSSESEVFDPDSAAQQTGNFVNGSLELFDKHGIKITYSNPTNIVGRNWTKGDKAPIMATVAIPIKLDGKVVSTIVADAGSVSAVLPSGRAKDIWQSKEFRQLIADTLGFDFNTDVDFAAAYESTFPVPNGTSGENINYTELVQDISKLVGRALFNLAFNNQVVPKILSEFNKNRTQSNIRAIINAQFLDSKNAPNLDPKTGLIPIVPELNKVWMLNHLSLAKAITNNVFSSAQVKTAEGTALSAYCLSRLRNSYAYLLVTQNRNKWSASNMMSFVRNRNGLYVGVKSSREAKTKREVKASTEMSGIETWSLNFYNDWVAAFVPKHRANSPAGDGGACFIPTVNSDKGLFDRLACNLYAESHIPSGTTDETGKAVGKRYIDLTDKELEQEVQTEFGPFYRNVISNITSELDRVQQILGITPVHKTENVARRWKESLKAISDYYVYPHLLKTITDPLVKAYVEAHPGTDWESDPVVREYIREKFVLNSGEKIEELLKTYKTIENLDNVAYEALYKKFYKKITKGLHQTLTLYNKTHTRNPILLAEHIHYTKGSRGLAINNVLVALWGRFGASEQEVEEAGIKDLYGTKNINLEIGHILGPNYGGTVESLTPEERGTIAAYGTVKEPDFGKKLLEQIDKDLYNRSLYSTAGYFAARDIESALKLLKDGCKIYLSGNKAKKQEETQFLRDLDNGTWITRSGMLAFALVWDEASLRIIPTNDVALIDAARKKGMPLKIHPMVSKLNRMDYLTTLLYVNCVGGAHYVYKGGSGANVLEEEANRWLASNKRNVCYASTVHKFLNKVLNGAPTVYNYAIINDIDAALYNIMGELKSHTPIDGGMMVNSFMPELENNSLGGEAAGTDKKHFATFYFELYGAGGITKTAGFAATNERMRTSEDWQVLQENMSNRKWIKEYGNANGDIIEELDITKDYDGNDINWQNKNVYYYREDDDGVVHFYKLAEVVKTDNPNEYDIWEYEVNLVGDIIDLTPTLRTTTVIDTNWKLFNEVFGGFRSLGREIDHHGVENPNSVLTFSENSRKFMVEAINRVGYRKTRNNQYNAVNKYGEPIVAYQLERTREEFHEDDLDDVWLPLKYSDVHFAPNKGAIKSSLMNMNPAEAMSEVMDLNIMPIKMGLLGIQLDKEHHADASELSMPTQIITACANKGYTLGKTTELYEALSTLTEIAIEDCMDGIMDLLPDGGHLGLLQTQIAQIIVDKLILSKDDNAALDSVMSHLRSIREAGGMLTPEEVLGTIPWSDSIIYNKVYSDLATHLTNKAIKLKISGSLAVICPTHHLERLYGNKRLTSLLDLTPGGKGIAASLREYQQLTRENAIFDRTRDAERSYFDLLNASSKIDTQHVYNVEYIHPLTGELYTKTITVNYPLLYWQIKRDLTKFKLTTKAALKGALAFATPNGPINVTDISEISIEEFYAHITGGHLDENGEITEASQLKVLVFSQLAEQGYTLEKLLELVGNDVRKARAFILFHEISHQEHLDHKSYPRKSNGKFDYLNKKAVDIETRATLDAWKKLEAVVNGDHVAELYLQDIAEVNNVHENVTKGRELSAYNVRFTSPETLINGKLRPERLFCMYDLDSLRLLYEVVNDVMPTDGPGLDEIQEFGKHRLATLDSILQFKASEPLLTQKEPDIRRMSLHYMITRHPEIWREYSKLEQEYKRLLRLAALNRSNREVAQQRNVAFRACLLFIRQTKKLNKDDKFSPADAFIESQKYGIKTVLRKAVQLDLFALSLDYNGPRVVMSLGVNYEIDPETIETVAYELIMPKIYKTVFGLKEHDDLLEILADPDFFARRSINKLKRTIADDSLYDYQLKRFSGDHLYILDARKGIPESLKEHPDFHFITEQDGSYSRVKMNGDFIYSIASPNDKVMITEEGTEVIITNNPEFYILDNLFNTATFSNSRVSEEELALLVKNLDNSSKSALKFKRIFANKLGLLKLFGDLRRRNLAFANISEEADQDTGNAEVDNLLAEIYNEGRAVHASFKKSLDIIAGRIPALSQQSFMTQKVVAFSDSDINTAYVSTFLLFILGSDLDIDTVNLIGPGFDRNGHYVMWSPYANINSTLTIEASETLPFPTGKTTEITHDNSKDSFFITYNDFFGEGKLFDFELGENGEIEFNEAGVPIIGIDTESPQVIRRLGDFLRKVKKEGLNLKGTVGLDGKWHYSSELDQEVYEQNLKYNDFAIFSELGIKPTLLLNILELIQKIVDDHNLYIKKADTRTKELMAKNLAYYLMYSIAAEPSNLTEGQESIDSTTKPIKGEGGAVEVAMSDEDKYDITSNNEKLSGPDPVSKVNSLYVNQVGKGGVSIGAKGVLGNSVVLFALDSILNSDASDEVKERILLPKHPKGYTYEATINGEKVTLPRRGYYINGKWRSAIANIHDKTLELTGISLQTSLEILGMLDEIKGLNEIPPNAATLIAAMLSVAVDNAKDLCLGKINAGPLMFGLYVYGLTLGMDIIELAQVMNSPLGRAIAKVLQGNVFTGELGATSVTSAIKYLNGETIGKDLLSFDTTVKFTNKDDGRQFNMSYEMNPRLEKADRASKVFLIALAELYKADNPKKDVPFKFSDLVYELASTKKLKTYLNVMQLPGTYFSAMVDTVSKHSKQEVKEWLESIYLLEEYLQGYASLVETWNADAHRKYDLKVLSEGADEMKRLGTMLGSNKGVKSKIEEGQNFINTLEESIIKRKELLGKKVSAADRIDYVMFCSDPDYREECIKKYEDVKHSINILQVVAATPHMFSYLRTCMIPYAGFMDASSRYRSVQAMIKNGAYEDVGIISSLDKTSANKGLNNEVGAMMMMLWLSDTRKAFILPKGCLYFDPETNELLTAKVNTPIALWTPEGLATFKHYMESYIIPKKLKKDAILKDNKFVQGLTPFSFNQTGTHATVSAYTLSGNMMPKEGTALDALLKEYLSAFKIIGNEKFPLSLDPMLADGSTIGNMKDAFFLYSLYVYGGRKSPTSLMALFDDGTSELQREFRVAVALMDASRDFLLTWEQQIRAMALNGSTYNPSYKYYYGTDNEAIGVLFFENQERTLSNKQKEELLELNLAVSKNHPFNLTTESGKGEIQALYFLYPLLDVKEQTRVISGIAVTFNGKKFAKWEETPLYLEYYKKSNMNDTLLLEQMIKDALAIDDAIKAVNENIGVLSSRVYRDRKITIEVKNLDILRAAIDASLKHSRGEC